MTDAASLAAARERRILDFARSDVFVRTFGEGMGLVEETAAYLDGPGRAASKRLDRNGTLTYAAESMRLTTRLMQMASWLLVQRALREGELPVADALQEKYRLSARADGDQAAGLPPGVAMPEELLALMHRTDRLFARVRRIDAQIYGEAGGEEPDAIGARAQFDLLRKAFDAG